MYGIKAEVVHFEKRSKLYVHILLSKRSDQDPDQTWPKSAGSGSKTLNSRKANGTTKNSSTGTVSWVTSLAGLK
jgi:hypothetical protein